MRRTLGTAVFAGMLGVTLFGIYLTPVFFYVVRGLVGGRRQAVPAAGSDGVAGRLRPACGSSMAG